MGKIGSEFVKFYVRWCEFADGGLEPLAISQEFQKLVKVLGLTRITIGIEPMDVLIQFDQDPFRAFAVAHHVDVLEILALHNVQKLIQ
jgi:hypothetical protein